MLQKILAKRSSKRLIQLQKNKEETIAYPSSLSSSDFQSEKSANKDSSPYLKDNEAALLDNLDFLDLDVSSK